MKFVQKWWLHCVLALLVAGLSFAVLEDFFPSLRLGPTERVVQLCAQFAEGAEMSQVQAIATQNKMKMSITQTDAIIKVGGGCMCVLEPEQGRIRRNTVQCSHSKKALFGAGK